MKYKILIAAFILFCSFTGPGDPPEVGISFNSFWKSKSVAIAGYTKINARYEWVAGAFDSGLHVPQYNGVPSGRRSGVWNADGAIAADTANNKLYLYSGGAWNQVGSTYTFTNGLTESGGTVKLGGDLVNSTSVNGKGSYSLTLDSLNGFTVRVPGLTKILTTTSQTYLYGNTSSTYMGVGTEVALIQQKSGNSLTMSSDSFNIKLNGNNQITLRDNEFVARNLNYTLSTTGKKIMLRDTATGLVQNIDPLLLAQEATNFADTTNFKPVVINTTGTAGTIGKIYKATYWPGGGGGGWGTTGTVATLTGASTLAMGTNNFTFASTGDANLMKIDAVNDRINISNSGIALGVLTVGGNTWINGSYLAVNDGSNQSTLGSTYLSLYNSFGTPEIRNASGHFQISPIAGYSTVINDNGVDADFRVEGDNDANLIFADAGNDKVGIGTASPNSKFEVNGSFATKYTATATGITLDGTHSVVNVTATGQTITLPTAASITGRQYTIKLTASGSATVATTSSQTIDGSTTYSLASQYKYVTVVSDGSNWIITANN